MCVFHYLISPAAHMSPINPPGRWGQERAGAARQGRPQPLGRQPPSGACRGWGDFITIRTDGTTMDMQIKQTYTVQYVKNMYYHIVLDFLIIVFNFFKFFVRFPFLF